MTIHRFDIIDIPFQIQLQNEYENGIQNINWIYDVNCKFKINSFTRCSNNPHSPLSIEFQDRLKDKNHLRYFLNVWHGYSHKPECSDEHSLRNMERGGMVTGEEIESGWASLNPIQYAIREMDDGARVDAITVQMIHINEQKVHLMGL